MTDGKGFWSKIGMDDYRGLIAMGLLGLAGGLAYMGQLELARDTLTIFGIHAAVYFYSKGE